MANLEQKRGVVNHGLDYEHLVPAYLAIQLLENPSIKNFTLKLNSSKYKKFDDLIVILEDGQKEYFAMQLKHKDPNRQTLQAKILDSPSDKNFSIELYKNRFNEENSEIHETHRFVLFTNVCFENMKSCQKYEIVESKSGLEKYFHDETTVCKTYQFCEKIQQPDKFYDKFFLLCRQKNVDGLRESIKKFFTGLTGSKSCCLHNLYIKFFERLRKGKYEKTEITRDEVILRLQFLLLQNFVVSCPVANQRNDNIALVEEAIQQFDVTVLRSNVLEIIEKHWQYAFTEPLTSKHISDLKDLKIGVNEKETSDDEIKRLTLFYFEEKPIFVKLTQESKKAVMKVLDLCKTMSKKIRFVLIEDLDEETLQNLSHFNTIEDVKNTECYNKLCQNFQISLQDRASKLISDFEFRHFITPSDLIRSLPDGVLHIGKKLKQLKKPYIERHLVPSNFNWKHLHHLCREKPVLIYCNNKSKIFRDFLKSNNYESHLEQNRIKLTDNCGFETKELCYRMELIITDKEFFLEYLDKSQHQLNAICDQPGAGKTTEMTWMARNYFFDFWVVVINLKQIEKQFWEKDLSLENILGRFIDKELNTDQDVISYLVTNKSCVWLIDGLDELDEKGVDKAIKMAKLLIEAGYKVWIFCTNILKNKLNSELENLIMYHIRELSPEEQRKYIEEKLGKKRGKIKQVLGVISETNHSIYTKIFRVPLYLYIITELVDNNADIDLTETLTLTKIFEKFISSNFTHFFKKMGYHNSDKVTEVFEYFYTKESKIVALQNCLDPAIFGSLNIKNDEYYIDYIKRNGDSLRLVELNQNKVLTFIHNSIASYFAAVWLTENLDKVPNLKEFLFEANYSEVLYFFNNILADNSPLHLSILEEDFSKIQELMTNAVSLDKGQRTPLHLAAMLEAHSRNRNQQTSRQILQFLLTFDLDLSRRDNIFEWNYFEYAVRSNSLSFLEELLKKKLQLPSLELSQEKRDQWCWSCLKHGYLKIFQKIFEIGGLAYLQDFQRRKLPKPFLHFVLERGHKQIAMFLIEKNYCLTQTDSQNKTVLHETAALGFYKIAKRLLEKNLPVDCVDSSGRTPLHFAAKMGHLQIVKLLHRTGADLNREDSVRKRTALHKAAYTGKNSILQFLLENGVSINALDYSDKNALQRAVDMKHLETVKFLLERGINVNAVDKNRKTSLHYAAFEGSIDIVRCLVTHKINVFLEDEEANTAQRIASLRGHQDIADYLTDAEKCTLERSLEPVTSNQNALFQAAHKCDLTAIERLLNEGTNINESINSSNDTILHIAAYEGNEELTRFLLAKGANTGATNKGKRVPLHIAAIRGHQSIVKLLIRKGQDDCADKWGIKPIHKAAMKGHLGIVKMFIEEAGLGVDCTTKDGGTPLHSAAREDQVDIIDWLLDNRADISLKTNSGKTCLHVAAQRGSLETVKRLLDKNQALIKIVDKRGRTALHWATETGHYSIIKRLVEAGSDSRLQDFDQNSAVDIAEKMPDREHIIEYFKQTSS